MTASTNSVVAVKCEEQAGRLAVGDKRYEG